MQEFKELQEFKNRSQEPGGAGSTPTFVRTLVRVISHRCFSSQYPEKPASRVADHSSLSLPISFETKRWMMARLAHDLLVSWILAPGSYS